MRNYIPRGETSELIDTLFSEVERLTTELNAEKLWSLVSGVLTPQEDINGPITGIDFHGQTLHVGDTLVDGDLRISGDVTIIGTATFVESENLEITDNIIRVNKGETGAGVTIGKAGVEVDRGTAPYARAQFNEDTDRWETGISGQMSSVIRQSDVLGDIIDDTQIVSGLTWSSAKIKKEAIKFALVL